MDTAVIFGCGGLYELKKDTIFSKYNVCAFIDNKKTGSMSYNNREFGIITPQEGVERFKEAIFIVCSDAFVAMSKQLLEMGVACENICFAQNFEPYGYTRIVFGDEKKIKFDGSKYIYATPNNEMQFEEIEEFNNIQNKLEIEYQKKICRCGYDEVEKMDLDIPKVITYEKCKQNDFYGHAYWVKRYCDIPEKDYIKASIEHACYMGKDYFWDLDLNHEFRKIITLSKKRKEILQRHTDKEVVMIGPYIAYVDYMDSKDFMDERKKQEGRVLVVFPSHSTDHVDIKFDYESLLKEIKRIGMEFDTVKICVHYADIVKGRDKIYRDFGYDIVSAGHLYDRMFLPRLKSLLYGCDMIMANDVGSYIGQAAFLGKPCYLYRQKCSFNAKTGKLVEEYDERKRDSFFDKMFEMFNKPSDKITDSQMKMIDYAWGLSNVKTKEELKKLLL